MRANGWFSAATFVPAVVIELDVAEMLSGHSTPDALRILHDELDGQLKLYLSRIKYTPMMDSLRKSFLHHSNAYSVFHWTSVLLIILSALLLIISYSFQTFRDCWLIVEVFVLIGMLVFNLYFLLWDDQLRRNEHVEKARRFLTKLDACYKHGEWSSANYIDLNCPWSQCVSLQWTIRDSLVINLPCGFLVEGDIILLRPGQVVPAKCRKLKTSSDDSDDELVTYEADELYNPAQNIPEPEFFSKIEARLPLKPQPFLVTETPFVKNFRTILDESLNRPAGMLDNERYTAYSVWCERRVLPGVFLVLLFANFLRYLLLRGHVGSCLEMIVVLQVEAILPLLAIVFPVIWRLLDMCGIAKIVLAFEESNQYKCLKRTSSGGSFKSETTLDSNVDLNFVWKDLMLKWKEILFGLSDTLPRTANLVQVLGNMTSFCCVDKKGVLSWPNPTAEKVFMLTNKHNKHLDASNVRSKHPSEKSVTPEPDPNINRDTQKNDQKNNKHGDSFPAEVCFQVLDLTQDTKNHYGLFFDDPSWRSYMSSLKPLGLNILLNTCNMETTDRYTEFADHVTCASLKREESVPVVNRRCFCELARQIGFGTHAMDIFKTEQMLGMYQHIPPESGTRDKPLESSKSFIKYKMPMPSMFSVSVKDETTETCQLFSQGTADLVLDVCSDFWDGSELRSLGEAERKKIADFYHRTSMSSYCTAFAYRPLSEVISRELTNLYLEIPEDIVNFRGRLANRPSDSKKYPRRHMSKDTCYHGSADSLITGSSDSPVVTDFEGCFNAQCNQIFIGMITMQYQAKQDIVDLIESLESACIRFVHFSKENELRSRVFSEKMGLEAGWNCHISLLSEKQPENNSETASEDSQGYGSHHSSKNFENLFASSGQSGVNILGSPNHLAPPAPSSVRFVGRGRSGSAPDMMSSQVRSNIDRQDSFTTSNDYRMYSSSRTNLERTNEAILESDNLNSKTPLLHNFSMKSKGEAGKRQPSGRNSVDKRRNSTSAHSMNASCSESKTSSRRYCGPDAGNELPEDKVTIVVHEEEEVNQGLLDQTSRTNSYVPSICSSYTGSLSEIQNRARLPKGIENIRSHIQNVDNVPLQVSLFTDCTPHTTREMQCILQEFGEVTCCLGSSSNIENTGIFLQADCGLAVEPVYPQICVNHSAIEKPFTDGRTMAPMELNAALHSLPCSLMFRADDHVTIIRLIAIARHHCQRLRSVSKLYLTCQLNLSLIQILNSLFLLPPALSPNMVLWLATLIVPLLSLTLMGNPINLQIAKTAQGKNRTQFSKQTVVEELVYFLIRHVPSLLVCLLCHAMNLMTFCQNRMRHELERNETAADCHVLFGYTSNNTDESWNGWYDDHRSGLVLSQQIVSAQLALYFVIGSLCSIHRLGHLWQKSPFGNHLWCIIIPIILVLQFLCFIVSVTSVNSNSDIVYSLSDVPVPVWVLALIWPFVLIILHELVKRREIKLWVRHQKRARLDFGTKLGMNSPF